MSKPKNIQQPTIGKENHWPKKMNYVFFILRIKVLSRTNNKYPLSLNISGRLCFVFVMQSNFGNIFHHLWSVGNYVISKLVASITSTSPQRVLNINKKRVSTSCCNHLNFWQIWQQLRFKD